MYQYGMKARSTNTNKPIPRLVSMDHHVGSSGYGILNATYAIIGTAKINGKGRKIFNHPGLFLTRISPIKAKKSEPKLGRSAYKITVNTVETNLQVETSPISLVPKAKRKAAKAVPTRSCIPKITRKIVPVGSIYHAI
jgi:hypothetical protein